MVKKLLAKIIPFLTKEFRTIEDCKECQRKLRLDLDNEVVIPPEEECLGYASQLELQKEAEYKEMEKEDSKQMAWVED